MQVDVYMPNPWNSGMLAWRMDKDGGTLNSNRIMNIAPWTVGNPFDFDGEWHTFRNLVGRVCYETKLYNRNLESVYFPVYFCQW